MKNICSNSKRNAFFLSDDGTCGHYGNRRSFRCYYRLHDHRVGKLKKKKRVSISTKTVVFSFLQGFCLWPVIQEIRQNKRLKEKQLHQGNGLEHFNHGYS